MMVGKAEQEFFVNRMVEDSRFLIPHMDGKHRDLLRTIEESASELKGLLDTEIRADLKTVADQTDRLLAPVRTIPGTHQKFRPSTEREPAA